MGGPAPWVNPEAVAPFVDAIVIGEDPAGSVRKHDDDAMTIGERRTAD